VTALAALAALALCAAPARAGDDAAPVELTDMAPAKAAPGWTRQANSLLLYGDDGGLLQELPLRTPDETGTVSRETLGGVSPDSRLAWTLERRLTWTPGRTKVLDSQRTFKVYGTSGQELWRDSAADLPERGAPVLFSADGKTLLLARRGDDGWRAEARGWMGGTIAALGPYPRLISMALTPNGRFALARWGVPDKSDTHTFLDLATKATKDVQSSELLLGLARIDDDGTVRSGPRVVFSFAPPAVSSAPAASTGTAVAP
jgi:hypothetical protein